MTPQTDSADKIITRLTQDLGLSKLGLKLVKEANSGVISLVGVLHLGEYKEGDLLLNTVLNVFGNIRDDILASDIVQDYVEKKLEQYNPFELNVDDTY